MKQQLRIIAEWRRMHEKNSTDGIAESVDRAGGWIKLCYRASHVDKYTEEDNYEFLRWIVFRANKGGNVTIDVHGQENIPKQDGFMFFPNHQGLYDVLAIVEACTHPFSVVAKKKWKTFRF